MAEEHEGGPQSSDGIATPAGLERVSVHDLVPDPQNARTHGDEQVAEIAGAIRAFGFNDPIGVMPNNMIVEGHGRLMAARRLGMESVPVIRLPHLSEAQRRAYVLAHNRIAEHAGWDDEILANELLSLRDEYDMDLADAGFSATDLEDLLAAAPGAEEDLGGETDPAYGEDNEASADGPGPGLAERFGIAPFSVFNGREGWWQDRKRRWIALGIRSEVGRGEAEAEDVEA